MDRVIPGIYRHYKGNDYEVLFTAINSETEEEMVIYKALYGEGKIWARPIKMWDDIVIRDGKKCKRFEYVINYN